MKKLTVKQLQAKLQKLIDDGHGDAQVLTSGMNTPTLRIVPEQASYIGPSEWDNRTWTFGKHDTPGDTVIL